MRKMSITLLVLAATFILSTQLSAQTASFSISGYKFYDANVNCVIDCNDVPIAGWKIEVYANSIDPMNLVATVYTGPDGSYFIGNLPPGVYIVREVLPLGNWVYTAPCDCTQDLDPNPYVEVYAYGGVYRIVLCGDSACGINFGNICLGLGGGATKGFWSNKNGQAIITQNWSTIAGSGALNCTVLAGLPYTNNSAPYLSSPEQIKVFLLNANAKDMRYMLAAQWLAMVLNFLVGDVDENAPLYTGIYEQCIGERFISAWDLATAVCTSWVNMNRKTQECYKEVLDWANENKNFVQPGPCCPIVYPW